MPDDTALEALRRSEERMRLMVEAVHDYAIFMLDTDGRVMSWNSGAERIKGYKASEVIGRHFSIFYTPEAQAQERPDQGLRRAKSEGRYEDEGWHVRKDGTLFWANAVITAIYDDQGGHIGFTKVTRDFTDRRKAEEELRQSEERFRLIIGSVRDYAIYMLDTSGRVASWNAGAEVIKGYGEDEVMGKHFSMFYPAEDAAAGRPQRELERAIADGRYEEEGWRVRKNGERFLADVVITAIYDETKQLRGFAKVTRDLTEWRRMEEEARLAEVEAIRERARAIEADKAVRLRDEFISIAAHELRTPLTALHLKLQSAARLVDKNAPVDSQQLAEKLRGARRQTGRITELVERLLDVSRIVAGTLAMKFEETNLTSLTAQVVDDLRAPALQARSDLRFHAAGPVLGTWDEARLEQVVMNLLSNAIKYGGGQPIEVRVEATDLGARLVVVDHGVGIAPEDRDRIFARFERVASAEHYGGLGLGLYITRAIVDAHGGSISVSNSAGQGSTFAVDLPRNAPPANVGR
jgi:PAS domain S-box-containing protein